jgi:TonB family protein
MMGGLILITSCAQGVSGKETKTAATASAQAPIVDSSQPKQVRTYLDAAHKLMKDGWDEVRANAAAMFPPGHAANQPDRQTLVELRIDPHGKPARLRVVSSSGFRPFDNSALRVMSWVKQMPALPESLGQGHVVLRWAFHRDQRACNPIYAKVIVHPFTPEEGMRLALDRHQWGRASQLLADHPGHPGLLALVAEVGLSSYDLRVRRMALRMAPAPQIRATLADPGVDPSTWSVGLRALEQRREEAAITSLLRQEVLPSSNWRQPAGAAAAKPRTRRISQLIRSLSRLKAQISGDLLHRLLTDRDHDVALATLPLVHTAAPLLRARKAWAKDPTMTSALAVRRLSLGPDKAVEKVVRWALGTKHREAALRALLRFPVPRVMDAVEALVKSDKTPTTARTLAAAAMGHGTCSSIAPLYIALRASDPQVQIAAARALGKIGRRGKKKAITYRLSDLAYRGRGKVTAVALACQARVGAAGMDAFRKDLLRRSRRLRKDHKALVVGSLWGYGPVVVPRLVKLADDPSPVVRAAAVRSLKRIKGPAAKGALAKVAPAKAGKAKPRRAGKDKAGPSLQLLILQAAEGTKQTSAGG